MKICGIDEAGRGALCGPLVVCGCVLKKEINNLDDSKKLSAKKREILSKEIIKNSNYLIIYISNKEIDDFGISKCMNKSLLSFKRYFSDFELIFDGNTDYKSGIKTLIRADQIIKEVSAASILAKVFRDNLMLAYDKIYPEYEIKNHKGYGTKRHIKLLKELGSYEIFRKSFKI